MILSNLEIHKALDTGKLVIKPEPLPRKPTIGQDCPYDTHTVDLKLGNMTICPRVRLQSLYIKTQKELF